MLGVAASTLLLVTLAAACGGGTASAGASQAASGDAPSPAASQAASGDASSAAPSAAASSGGGNAAGVCELVATDQLTEILQVASVTTEVVPGPPDTCIVKGPEGNAIVSWSHTTQGGRAVYDALALPGQSEDVPGIGDAAAFVENTGLLVVKGDGLVTIQISGESGFDEFDGPEVAREIASEMVANL
jgi:hypothetical protein